MGDGTVTILWQRSDRRFERSREIPLNIPADQLHPFPTCIAASDIDGDGDDDHPDIDLLVAPNRSYYPFVILMRNNNGQFDLEQLHMPASPTTIPLSPKCVTVTDIDNDGDPDILATSGQTGSGHAALSQQVTLFRNLGDGDFASPEHFTPNPNTFDDNSITGMQDLTSADLDGDNYPEVIVKGEWTVGILKNETTSGIPFSHWVSYYRNWYYSELVSIAAADIESDYGDNLVVLQANGTVNVARNLNGLLDNEGLVDYAVGSGVQRGIGTGDINNDGDIDILIPEPSNNSIALLRNSDGHNLLPAQHLPVSAVPTGIYVGNLDKDDRLEIAVSNIGTDDVWVLHVRPEPVSRDQNGNGVPDSCEPTPGLGDTNP